MTMTAHHTPGWERVTAAAAIKMPEWVELKFSEADDGGYLSSQNTTFKYLALYGEPETTYWRPASVELLEKYIPYAAVEPAIAKARGQNEQAAQTVTTGN